MKTTLESRPVDERTKAEYLKAITAFRAVYHVDPAFAKVPAALAAVAELYEEMGHRFSEDEYYQISIKAYEFLRHEYPQSLISREALFTIGEIYLTDLNDPQSAEGTYGNFLASYPKSDKAPQARARLKQIRQLLTENQSGPLSTGEAPGEERETGSQTRNQIAEVTSIRRWVGPNYSRIVIGVDGDVKFDASRLSSPDRLVFDLSNARPSPALMGKTFPVEDGYLRQIRVGQFKPNITRVVLDVQKIKDYSVFPLPNPYRLVIDIHGPASVETAKSEPAEPEVARSQHGEAKASPRATPTLPMKSEPSSPSASTEAAVGKTAPGRATNEGHAAADVAGANPLPIRPAAPTDSGGRTLTRALGLKIGRIVIDPGHGGHDTGTIGPTGLMEKDVVLDVGLRLAKLLRERAGAEVVMTRSDDTFIPLEERTAIANEKAADLFISIHANASRDPSARGIETYYLNFTSDPAALEVAARENATSQESVHELRDLIKKIALSEKVEESRQFALDVQRQLYNRVDRSGVEQPDRGVKKAPFVVLIGANMPSILAEISFLTNPKDERLLKRPLYREKIAEALYAGIEKYAKSLGGVQVAQQARPSGSSDRLPAARDTSENAAPGNPKF